MRGDYRLTCPLSFLSQDQSRYKVCGVNGEIKIIALEFRNIF